MGGGLLQLVAYGAQDAYLTGNPQITFWRGLYKRHTNFAMEPFRVNLTGQAAWGSKHSAILPRHADLLFNTYLEVDLPAYGVDVDPLGPTSGDIAYGWSGSGLGYKLIKYVELDIGGQVIDRLYGEWLTLWSVLTSEYNASLKIDNMTSLSNTSTMTNVGDIYTTAAAGCNTDSNGFRTTSNSKLYIPLSFYFCRNPGAALPLIALQYHEVKINVLWNTPEFVTTNYQYSYSGSAWVKNGQPPVPPAPKQVNLLVDYVYLDVEERRRMAQESHEYLIEQTQFNEDKGISAANTRIDLTFNHPVKELVWLVQETGDKNCKYLSSNNTTSPHAIGDTLTTYYAESSNGSMGLQINGQDRVPLLKADYFNKVQPYQHHSGRLPTGTFCYSFAIRPEEHQPSGTCNFSRIDTATLVVNNVYTSDLAETDSTLDIRVYAVNYNVLRVMSGMAGLAYSN